MNIGRRKHIVTALEHEEDHGLAISREEEIVGWITRHKVMAMILYYTILLGVVIMVQKALGILPF